MPLKWMPAKAPGYVLRFDLAGIPYQEPAFSGIRPRQGEDDPDVIGIAYLLTLSEYERLLLSEGGRDGGYVELDITVRPLTNDSAEAEILCKSLGTRTPRENPHPLPSNRYLSLLRRGAAEHQFPLEYVDYLEGLPAYSISSWRTQSGRILFLMTWLVPALFVFALMATTTRRGKPKWVQGFQMALFKAMWSSHDRFFSPIFGPGDTSVGEEEGHESKY
jgi:gliotoxin/aspirochlorine biosynthesis gamma-glutamylcyclotransferase